MVIYLVRHGKDDDAYRGGWSQLGLIDEGINQAKLLADYLYENKDAFNINTLISSDLKRATETAEEIGYKLGLPVLNSPECRETNNGALAGMLNTEALEKYPGLFFNTLRMDESYPEGESPLQFFNRIKVSFENLCNSIECRKTKSNVMLVTHSGVINIIYYILYGLEWTNKSPNLCRISNTSVHKLEYTAEGWIITKSNITDHLTNTEG